MKANPKPRVTCKIPDEGVALAWLYSIVDLGTQTTTYKGEEKHQRKLRFTWELCDTKVSDEDPRPVSISQEYTWSFHEKSKLRLITKSWTGKEPGDSFDLEELYKHPCQLSIVHTKSGEKTYANIGAIMPIPKGMKVTPRQNPTITFDIDDQRCNALEFLKLPDFIKAKILKSPEGRAKFEVEDTGAPDPVSDEDIPF